MRLSKLMFLPLLLLGVGATACQPAENKVDTIFGSKLLEESVEINYGTLDTLVTNKFSFILVQYPDCACASWDMFEAGILNKYIKETGLKIYKIIYTEFDDVDDKFGLTLKEESQTLSIFDKGVKKYEETDVDSDIFLNYENFKTWIETLVKTPTVIEINEEILTTMYSGYDDFNIYFSRSGCPDCNIMERLALKNYWYNNEVNGVLYYIDLDVEGIRLDAEGNVDNASYTAFKDKFGLSVNSNPILGYGSGYVPTIQHISPRGSFDMLNNVKDMFVYGNDTIAKEGEKYIVKTSYFTEERKLYTNYEENVELNVLQGMEVSKNEITEYPLDDGSIYYYWSGVHYNKYYEPLFNAFMDKYLDIEKLYSGE